MPRAALGAALCLAILPGVAAAQNTRVYEGSEAAALRCSNMLALTAVALEGGGFIPERDKDVMLGVTVLILERHVSGTWAQKKRALRIMRDRRSVPDTLEDYQKNARRCLRQFPIN